MVQLKLPEILGVTFDSELSCNKLWTKLALTWVSIFNNKNTSFGPSSSDHALNDCIGFNNPIAK